MQRLAAFLATALFSSVLLSGCVAESSRTQLDSKLSAIRKSHGVHLEIELRHCWGYKAA